MRDQESCSIDFSFGIFAGTGDKAEAIEGILADSFSYFASDIDLTMGGIDVALGLEKILNFPLLLHL